MSGWFTIASRVFVVAPGRRVGGVGPKAPLVVAGAGLHYTLDGVKGAYNSREEGSTARAAVQASLCAFQKLVELRTGRLRDGRYALDNVDLYMVLPPL